MDRKFSKNRDSLANKESIEMGSKSFEELTFVLQRKL